MTAGATTRPAAQPTVRSRRAATRKACPFHCGFSPAGHTVRALRAPPARRGNHCDARKAIGQQSLLHKFPGRPSPRRKAGCPRKALGALSPTHLTRSRTRTAGTEPIASPRPLMLQCFLPASIKWFMFPAPWVPALVPPFAGRQKVVAAGRVRISVDLRVSPSWCCDSSGLRLSRGRSGKTTEHLSTLPIDGVDQKTQSLACRRQPAQTRAERCGLIGQDLRQLHEQTSKLLRWVTAASREIVAVSRLDLPQAVVVVDGD